MTVPLFVNEIQDFADFSFNKWVWYKNANTKSGLIVDLSYSRWSLDDLVKHGALYNGLANANIRGNIAPANPDYVW